MRKSRLIRRRFRNIFYTVGFLLSTAAISQASYGFLMEAPYFAVTTPQIQGVSEGVRKEIAGLVTSFLQGKNSLVMVDTAELEQQIALHPRVRDIKVEKRYPNQLKITAVEREEVAIAATETGFYLLDNEGHVMDKLDIEELVRFDLPYIAKLRPESVHEGETVDSASLDKALLLIQVLKDRNQELYRRISEVEIQQEQVSPLETLVLHMKGGLDIMLGDGNPVEKLPALETLLAKLQAKDVQPFSDLVYIDLSYDKLGFYMDKETALIVNAKQYDIVQQAMQDANDEYAKKHPEANAGAKKSESSDDDDAAPARSTRRAPAEPDAARPRSRQQGTPAAQYNGQAPPAGYYRAPQQAYPQQRYPQAQYRQQQAPPSYYNMQNQQR
jgi:cell division protein FtsQ